MKTVRIHFGQVKKYVHIQIALVFQFFVVQNHIGCILFEC
jgi:hypothetical protein